MCESVRGREREGGGERERKSIVFVITVYLAHARRARGGAAVRRAVHTHPADPRARAGAVCRQCTDRGATVAEEREGARSAL